MTPNATAASAVAASRIPTSATLLSPLPPACPTAFNAPRSEVFSVASGVVVGLGLPAELSGTVSASSLGDVPVTVRGGVLPLFCVVDALRPVAPLVSPPVAVGIVSMYC
jgi:hypothetical protein